MPSGSFKCLGATTRHRWRNRNGEPTQRLRWIFMTPGRPRRRKAWWRSFSGDKPVGTAKGNQTTSKAPCHPPAPPPPSTPPPQRPGQIVSGAIVCSILGIDGVCLLSGVRTKRLWAPSHPRPCCRAAAAAFGGLRAVRTLGSYPPPPVQEPPCARKPPPDSAALFPHHSPPPPHRIRFFMVVVDAGQLFRCAGQHHVGIRKLGRLHWTA